MKKKVYERPFMMAQLFEPQSYCSGCGPTETDKGKLYAVCAGTDQIVKITYMNNEDLYTGECDGYGGGQLKKDMMDPTGKTWVYAGTITTGHDPNFTMGEFMPSDDQHPVGHYEVSTGMTYCNHHYDGIARHHHLTDGHIVYVNHSQS